VLNNLRILLARLFGYVMVSNSEVRGFILVVLGLLSIIGLVMGVIWVTGFVFRSGWDAADKKGDEGQGDEVPF
jgi:hypothetical protein